MMTRTEALPELAARVALLDAWATLSAAAGFHSSTLVEFSTGSSFIALGTNPC